ncbi:MAG: hypothetical protein ACPGLV_16110, partial [Bacteroidia bacterium]
LLVRISFLLLVVSCKQNNLNAQNHFVVCVETAPQQGGFFSIEEFEKSWFKLNEKIASSIDFETEMQQVYSVLNASKFVSEYGVELNQLIICGKTLKGANDTTTLSGQLLLMLEQLKAMDSDWQKINPSAVIGGLRYIQDNYHIDSKNDQLFFDLVKATLFYQFDFDSNKRLKERQSSKTKSSAGHFAQANTVFGADITDINLPEQSQVEIYVDQKATFPGGSEKMLVFINEHIKLRPGSVREKHNVILNCVVGADGYFKKADFLKESPDQRVNQAVLKALAAMPQWQAAKLNNKTVSSLTTIIVTINVN